jgi:hypothetical protein
VALPAVSITLGDVLLKPTVVSRKRRSSGSTSSVTLRRGGFLAWRVLP